MPYITQQDLIDEVGQNRLVQLTDETNSGAIGIAKVERALAYAEGTFDSYARTRYTIPVPVTPKVKSVCIDLAVFHLYKNRATVLKDGVFEVKERAHDAAMSFLKDIAAGRAALDVPTVEETIDKPASPDEVLRGSAESPGVFSDDSLAGY